MLKYKYTITPDTVFENIDLIAQFLTDMGNQEWRAIDPKIEEVGPNKLILKRCVFEKMNYFHDESVHYWNNLMPCVST